MKQPRFSIHDAFEEENDEAIRVYGSTVASNIPKPSGSGAVTSASSNKSVNECDPRFVLKCEMKLLSFLQFRIEIYLFFANHFHFE